MKPKEIVTNPNKPGKPTPPGASQKIQKNLEILSEKFKKTCKWILKNFKINKKYDEIPGPIILKATSKIFKIAPFLGQQTSSSLLEILLFSDSFFNFFKITSPVSYLRQQYGTIVHIPGIFGGQFVLLTHPDYLQLVLNHENDLRSCFDSLDHYSKIDFKKKNLISIKEKLEQHLTTDPSIHENIHKTTNDFIEWIKKSRDTYDEVPNNFSEEINKLSLECIWSIIFTTRINIFQPVIPPEQHLFTDSIIGASSALLSCEKGFQLWRIFDTKNWIKLCDDLNAIDCILGKHICKKNNSLIEGLFTSGVSKEEINMIVREIFVVGTILVGFLKKCI